MTQPSPKACSREEGGRRVPSHTVGELLCAYSVSGCCSADPVSLTLWWKFANDLEEPDVDGRFPPAQIALSPCSSATRRHPHHLNLTGIGNPMIPSIPGTNLSIPTNLQSHSQYRTPRRCWGPPPHLTGYAYTTVVSFNRSHMAGALPDAHKPVITDARPRLAE